MTWIAARLAGCMLLASLAGCLVDRGALEPPDAPDPFAFDAFLPPEARDAGDTLDAPDARSADEDGGLAEGDAGVDPPDANRATCGDGALAAGEECDDANAASGDGCDPGCRFERTRRVIRGPDLAIAVPDDAYDGSLGSMTCVELAARPFPLDTVTSVEVEVAMQHPWVADLVMKLVGPRGAPVVTLMSRPGIDEPADDGTRRSGNDADLDPASPIRFVTGAAVSAEDMGDGIGDRTVCEADGICEFAPDPGAATPGDLDGFVGGPASGEWRFCVGDGAGADVGALDAVTLTLGLGP